MYNRVRIHTYTPLYIYYYKKNELDHEKNRKKKNK